MHCYGSDVTNGIHVPNLTKEFFLRKYMIRILCKERKQVKLFGCKSLFYSIKTRFVQVRCFGEGMKKVFGNIKFFGKKNEGGGLSSFQALATAIAAQVGTGNIVGACGAILTGGPGTGKTTTINFIIKLFESQKYRIALCAPTGRAAKRMTELTGKEAKTIHRLLEVEWDEDDKPVFRRDTKNPLDCNALILDELSMVDISLFASLFQKLYPIFIKKLYFFAIRSTFYEVRYHMNTLSQF